MHSDTSIVLYTKTNAQCDKQAMVIGPTELTVLATVDISCFGDTRIPFQDIVG